MRLVFLCALSTFLFLHLPRIESVHLFDGWCELCNLCLLVLFLTGTLLFLFSQPGSDRRAVCMDVMS